MTDLLPPPVVGGDSDDRVDWPERPSWHSQAACRGMDPNIFFPVRGELVDKAKVVCNACPVRDACLEQGMQERYGIWGGANEKGRRRIRASRRLTTPPGPKIKPIRHGTPAGYRAHFRRNVPTCDACIHANRIYAAAHRRSRAKTPGSSAA